MIRGIGTDVVEIARMDAGLARFGDAFAQRLLAPAEWAAYRQAANAARFLAKRFAAKEAFAKALGSGLRAPATLRNIAIVHDALGKPAFEFAAPLQAQLESRGIAAAHLSISDEKTLALAFVVLEA
jgi:holo-[acyl-carrier protein] synthase